MAGRFARLGRSALRLAKLAGPKVAKAVGLGALSSAAGLGIEQLLKGNGLFSSRTLPGLGGGGRRRRRTRGRGRRRVFASPGLSRGGGRRRRVFKSPGLSRGGGRRLR